MFELICKHCKNKFSSRRRRALKGGHMQYAHKSLAFDSDVAAATWSSINDHHGSIGGIDYEKSEQFNWSNRHDGDAGSSLLNKFDGNDDDRAVFESIYVQALSYRIKLNSSSSKIRKICKKEWSRLSKISDELPEERDEGRGEADDVEEDCDDNDCQEDASIKETAISASFYSNIAEHDDGVCSVGDNAYDQTIMKTSKPLNSHNKSDHIPLSLKSRDPKLSKRFVDDRECTCAMETASHASALVAPSTTKSSSSNDLPSDKAHACTECRREFSSRKALFGHMRCHPEREWRGIHRPILHIDQENPCKIKKSPSPCEESDEILSAKLDNQANSDDNVKAENIDVSFMNGESKISIRSWMRGKRSKRPRQVVRSLKMVTDNASKLEAFNASSGANDETDMANCLVLLAACASRDQTQAPPPLKKMKKTALILSTEIIDRRLHDRHKMISSDPDVSVNHLCQRKDQIAIIKPNFKVNAQNQSVCEGLPEGGADIEQEEGCDVEAGEAKHHECPTCKRMFKSHQALGGHRASHKKVKGCFARTAGPTELSTEEEEVTEEDLLRSLKTERIISASGSTHGNQIKNYEKEITRSCRSKKTGSIRKKLIKGHECSICYRIFPSGQALGGHKRCHWGRAGSFETSIIPVSSPSHSHSHSQQKHPSLNHGFQRRGREELQLDLNLPAPEEENENFYMDERSSNSAPHLNFE